MKTIILPLLLPVLAIAMIKWANYCVDRFFEKSWGPILAWLPLIIVLCIILLLLIPALAMAQWTIGMDEPKVTIDTLAVYNDSAVVVVETTLPYYCLVFHDPPQQCFKTERDTLVVKRRESLGRYLKIADWLIRNERYHWELK